MTAIASVDVIVVTVEARLTVRLSTADVAGAQLASPPHTAEIWCVPTGNATMAYAAPGESVPEPIATVPSRNETAPVGGAVPLPDTCAKSVTGCP